jgi:hypothetical protein
VSGEGAWLAVLGGCVRWDDHVHDHDHDYDYDYDYVHDGGGRGDRHG